MNSRHQASPPETPNLSAGLSGPRQVAESGRVRAQLELVLDSPPFRNSKRYPALLRYVVERTLEGETSALKERTLGIDVFGRAPDYDPAADPVVRTSAGEVRKRLTEYYRETAHAGELRITLPLGSYIPEFREPESIPAEPLLDEPVPRRRRVWLVPLLVASLALVAGLGWYLARPVQALDAFWRPVVVPRGPVLVCVGESKLGRNSEAPAGIRASLGFVPWTDAQVLVKVTNLLQAQGASPQACLENQTSFADLQQVPAVLIGGLNDEWALRLMQNMRYQVRREGTVLYVSDLRNQQSRQWSVDLGQLSPDGTLALQRDYAVISRVANPRTGRMTVMLAGLWGHGTFAAGQFATDNRFLQTLARKAPPNWEQMNLQIVIETEVIEHAPGPPRIVAEN